MTCSVARDPSFAHTGPSNLRSASSSRVPCRNSMGTVTFVTWSALFVPGCLGGCSGKPKNTNPRTPSSGCCAAACEVMRPPMDLPPANSSNPGAASAALRAAAATVAVRTVGWSGIRRRCSMYGNWYRNVATPTPANSSASFSINGWLIPAPAPCARTRSHRAFAGRQSNADTSPPPSTPNRNCSTSAISPRF